MVGLPLLWPCGCAPNVRRSSLTPGMQASGNLNPNLKLDPPSSIFLPGSLPRIVFLSGQQCSNAGHVRADSMKDIAMPTSLQSSRACRGWSTM